MARLGTVRPWQTARRSSGTARKWLATIWQAREMSRSSTTHTSCAKATKKNPSKGCPACEYNQRSGQETVRLWSTTMPVHDWTRVEAGIFHAFHHSWVEEIGRALNRGLLPPGYYALPEQIAGAWGPDVLTLKGPAKGGEPDANPPGAVALAVAAPKVHFRARAEVDIYATKAKAIVVRHTSRHQVIAVVEVVSPGNKNSRRGLHSFIEKAVELLRAGVHLLIVD